MELLSPCDLVVSPLRTPPTRLSTKTEAVNSTPSYFKWSQWFFLFDFYVSKLSQGKKTFMQFNFYTEYEHSHMDSYPEHGDAVWNEPLKWNNEITRLQLECINSESHVAKTLQRAAGQSGTRRGDLRAQTAGKTTWILTIRRDGG